MFIEFKTIVTHKIELGGENGIQGVEHSVLVDCDSDASAFGESIIFAISASGLKSALRAYDKRTEHEPIDLDEED